MNIKSLLIGSAATMVAVSGAQAADAIVVEPEPVEYVRVCDAYGTGFFFIPGTETCIRFSGYIRSAYAKLYDDTRTVDLSAAAVPEDPTAAELTAGLALARIPDDISTATWTNRARLNVDTRNETEWGTLRGLFRIEGSGNERGNVIADVAMISLAGFRLGMVGDNYWATNHGFGGVDADEAVLGAGGFYGVHDATALDYTFAAEGFSVTVGVEDPESARNPNDFNGTASNAGGTGDANFYAGFNYTADFGHVAFTGYHDSTATNITAAGVSVNSGEWAWKVSASLDLSEFIPGGSIWGWYLDDGDANSSLVSTGGANAENIWGVAFAADLTDEFGFWANYWSGDGGWAALGATNGVVAKEGDAHQWALGLNWFPSAAPGFEVRFAYINGEYNNRVTQGAAASTTGASTFASPASIVSGDYDGFEISVRRNF